MERGHPSGSNLKPMMGDNLEDNLIKDLGSGASAGVHANISTNKDIVFCGL